jgi:DNA-binding PadR family transcriptional regulator
VAAIKHTRASAACQGAHSPRRRPAIIPLGYALLGLLARTSLSGYDVIREMEEPVGFFWHARRGQIYPELARLEQLGLVEHAVVEQRDRPDKKVYTITPAGLEALREWVTRPMRLPLDRDEFMLKIYSLWLADPQQALALVRAHEGHHAARLARYQEIETEMLRDWPPEARRLDAPKFAAYATLRRGIEYERGYAEWCRWLAGAIEGSTRTPG